MSDSETLLAVRDLRTYFQTGDGLVKAVDGVSFRIPNGRTFALVGESGCGKSVTAYSVLRLLATPPAQIASGRVELEGRNLLELTERQMRDVRGGKISMIFQEPMTSLNPVYTCGDQIVEAVRLHRRLSSRQARDLAIEMLAKVGIADPAERFGQYPHQLSGGMRQRVMIAMALSCGPKLLIADEPTTALDVTIQAQILDLLAELQRRAGLSIMLITHDLAVVAETAHEVAVMYASRLAEVAVAEELFGHPLHPYTRGLLRSIPRLGERVGRLQTIPGNVPNPLEFPSGCKFHPRCPLTRRLAKQASEAEIATIPEDGRPVRVIKQCATDEPDLREVQPRHWCACWQVKGFEQAPATSPAGPGDGKEAT